MIAQLMGQVVNKTSRGLVVNCGGVGYEVSCTTEVLSKIKLSQDITLYTHLNVREDLMDLYGFISRDELDFFKLLLTVSGVGPKSALNILEIVKPSDIRLAVSRQDASSLHVVHGLGKKTAEKLVVELKDKLETQGLIPAVTGDEQAILEAIINLGYSQNEARQAVKNIKNSSGTIEDKIRSALKSLSRA